MEGRKQFTFYRSHYEAIRQLKKADAAALVLAICAYALDGEEPSLTGPSAATFALIRPTLDAGRRKAESRIGKQGRGKSGTIEEEADKKPEEIDNKPEQTDIIQEQAHNIREQTDNTQEQTDNKSEQTDNKSEEEEKEKRKETEKEKEKEKKQKKEKEKEGEKGKEEREEYTPPNPPSGGITPAESAEARISALPGCLPDVVRQWLLYKQERREPYKPAGLTALVSQIGNQAAKYGAEPVAETIRASMASGYKGIVFDRLRDNAAKPMSVKVPGGNTDWTAPSEFARDAVRRMMDRDSQQAEGQQEPLDPNVQAALDSIRGESHITEAILQRRLKIGYAEASRIMDKLEQLGAVGPYCGGSAREVLVK